MTTGGVFSPLCPHFHQSSTVSQLVYKKLHFLHKVTQLLNTGSDVN